MSNMYRIRVYRNQKDKTTGDWVLSSQVDKYQRTPNSKVLANKSLFTNDMEELLVWYCEHMLSNKAAVAVLEMDNTSINYLHNILGSALQGVIGILVEGRDAEKSPANV